MRARTRPPSPRQLPLPTSQEARTRRLGAEARAYIGDRETARYFSVLMARATGEGKGWWRNDGLSCGVELVVALYATEFIVLHGVFFVD